MAIEPTQGLLYTAVGAFVVREFFGFIRWVVKLRHNSNPSPALPATFIPADVGMNQQTIIAGLNSLAGQVGAVHLELVRSHTALTKISEGNKSMRDGMNKNFELCNAILREVQRGPAHKP